MEGLTREQLEHFKAKLVERKAEIENQLQSFAKKNDKIKDDYETVFPQIDNETDLEENADEVTEYENSLAIEHDLEDDLMEVEAALTRIEDGTYGMCSNCNRPISTERLEAMPEATVCIECE